MKRPCRWMVLPALVMLSAGWAWADKIVFFKTGRGLVVSDVEEREGWLFLNFVGGGILGVPASTVDRVEETDMAQEIGSNFGNTIQSPDVSRGGRGGSGRTVGRTSYPGGSATANPGSPSGRRGAQPGANLQRNAPPLQQPQQGRPGVQSPQNRNPVQPGPFGLYPLNLNPDANQETEEEEEEE